MKRGTRFSLAGLLAISLMLSVPASAGVPRDGRGSIDIPVRIQKLIAKVQSYFGISTNTDYPTPPRP